MAVAVLAMTVNPLTASGVAAVFSPDVLYQFKIDNTGDYLEDLVIQVTFNNVQPNQQFKMVGPVASPAGSAGSVNPLIASGPTLVATANDNQVKVGANGQRAFVGRREDPFFADLIFLRGVLNVTPPIARPPGQDFFNGLNVSMIVGKVYLRQTALHALSTKDATSAGLVFQPATSRITPAPRR